MVTLYGFKRVLELIVGATRDLRVEWVLQETGEPYCVHGLDFIAGDLNSAEFRRVSPFGQLPILDDEGFLLSESGAIVLYLADKAGKLIPRDLRGRAEVTRWCFVALNTLELPVLEVAEIDFAAANDPSARARRPEAVKAVDLRLASIDTWLDDRAFVTGPDFTVADILLTTVLRQAKKLSLLEHWPRLDEYRARCEARPAWQRALDRYEERLGVKPGSAR